MDVASLVNTLPPACSAINRHSESLATMNLPSPKPRGRRPKIEEPIDTPLADDRYRAPALDKGWTYLDCWLLNRRA